MFYLYILINQNGLKTYTGVTDNLDRRIQEHNKGKVKSSEPYTPYELLHSECFVSLGEVMEREKFYKSTTGRRKLRNFVILWKQTKRLVESAET